MKRLRKRWRRDEEMKRKIEEEMKKKIEEEIKEKMGKR